MPGSREMLAATASTLYARRVIIENNPDVPMRTTPRRIRAELRWAWLLEGAARWFGGQTPTPGRRSHAGCARGAGPAFPPGVRDAPLLGGTVIDLLVRERGEPAAARLACRLHPSGRRAALREAFGGTSPARIEEAWRDHLARMAAGA